MAESFAQAGLKRIVIGVERSLANIRTSRDTRKRHSLPNIFIRRFRLSIDGIFRRSKQRLIELYASCQMGGRRSHISDLPEQIVGKFGLYIKVVLLRVRTAKSGRNSCQKQSAVRCPWSKDWIGRIRRQGRCEWLLQSGGGV